MQKEKIILPEEIVTNYITEENKKAASREIKIILHEFFDFINLKGNNVKLITRTDIARYHYYLKRNRSKKELNLKIQTVLDFVFYAEQKGIIKRIRWRDLLKRSFSKKKE